jgi:hypothetical protein
MPRSELTRLDEQEPEDIEKHRDTEARSISGKITFSVAARSARLPTDPDAPNIAVLPNHVTMPIGVAIVEGQVEFVR